MDWAFLTNKRGPSQRGRREGHRFGRAGLTDVVALGQVAAQLAQELEHGGVLDALGDHAQAERVAELDRRPDELHVTVAVISDQQCGEDRKSTRLNSSHLGISYAV